MEKNRIRPVINGKSLRMSYSRQKEVLEMPNLIEVQKNSYNWFLEEGLKEVFADISPIADYSGHLSLEFTDFRLCEDEIKYTIPECKERDATYAAPLRVKVRLYNKEADEINEHEIFMGDLPLMTETGTFVINGAERVIVSQLVRSPGIYYGIAHDKIGNHGSAVLRLNTIIQNMFCSAVTAISVLLLVRAGIGVQPDKIMIGDIMLVIPGLQLTNSLRDMINGDMISGLLNMSEALLKAVAVAIGFAGVIILGGAI